MSLVTCSNQVQWILISISTNLQGFVNTLSDVRRLFHQRWVYSHRLSRKSIFCIGITNLCNGITNHTRLIHIGICRNFTKNVDRTSIYSCFSSNVCASGLFAKSASKIASEIWSAILSGCPSDTDSDVNFSFSDIKMSPLKKYCYRVTKYW